MQIYEEIHKFVCKRMQKNTITILLMNTMSSHTCLVCLGSNLCPEVNMDKACEALTRMFPDIRWSPVIVSPDIRKIRSVPDYHNRVALFTTTMSMSSVRSCFKELERSCGRTSDSKSTDLVPLDIDLLRYGDTIFKSEDMHAPYVLQGLDYLTGK